MQFTTIAAACLFSQVAFALKCNISILKDGEYFTQKQEIAGWEVKFEDRNGNFVGKCKNAHTYACTYVTCKDLAPGYSPGKSWNVVASGNVGSLGSDPSSS
ncbi:uncharacterized protein PgNI_08036 [Pyricularia grisea]|uniref:Uncharacterized protein n=1 Tax=Pyricularia grisea TaxID=148305 RepID=A0A6P8AVX8_PYRGI|nr:uncharacterized protein PgNI_08036 [Pyricularia grisea]TLD06347.1 hypothetical protein PgNI_08036 [Pyricularia grisea]